MSRMLIALDIDGTILGHDGIIPRSVYAEVDRLRDAGHEVMIATGRSFFDAKPVHDKLGLTSDYIVCANGACTMKRDPSAPEGYSPDRLETFDATDVLKRLHVELGEAHYAVETPTFEFLYAGGLFPEATFEAVGREVPFEELLDLEVMRVVVVAPNREVGEFMDIVERSGLHQVSYSVGWTSWLDIAPDGVNKATALEYVRENLGIPRTDVFAIGDGRNDIEMLEWAGAEGWSVAMGQAPQEVFDAADSITSYQEDDGLAEALKKLPRAAAAVPSS